MKSRIYTTQIILNLGYPNGENTLNNQAAALAKKWDKNHPDNPCLVMNWDSPIEHLEFEALTQPVGTGYVKILVTGHGARGKDYFGRKVPCEEEDVVYSSILANTLAKFIENNQLKGRVLISLVACNAGKESAEGDKSFAEKFHYSLKNRLKHNIPVKARNHFVKVKNDTGKKVTFNLNFSLTESIRRKNSLLGLFNTDDIHEQPGSINFFTSDKNGQRIKVDYYYHFWERKVFATLRKEAKKTKCEAKAELIRHWLYIFKKMKSKEIYDTLSAALKNPRSDIHLRSDIFSCLFSSNSAACAIKKLIEARDRMLSSPHTFKKIIAVGDTRADS